MIKGVILDFNGTMYQDHDLNHKSWGDTFYSVRPSNSNLSFEEFNENAPVNDYLYSKKIFDTFNIKCDDDMINELSEKKEIEYRQLAIDAHRSNLTKGIEKFLDFLKENNIPYCIASMAPKSNFDFYLDYLHLDKWFTYDNIVYDDGKYFSKNAQVVDAARILNLDPKDCLLIEDSPRNIKLAIEELGMRNVLYITSKKKEYISKEIIQELKDFENLDYSIFD